MFDTQFQDVQLAGDQMQGFVTTSRRALFAGGMFQKFGIRSQFNPQMRQFPHNSRRTGTVGKFSQMFAESRITRLHTCGSEWIIPPADASSNISNSSQFFKFDFIAVWF